MGIRKLLGLKFPIEDEGEAEIIREDVDKIYIESSFYTGWVLKADFWESWGVVDGLLADS
jgi:hypothetical protein